MSAIALAALAAVPGLIKAGTGIYQSAQAKKLEKDNPRPKFETPDQITSATELARRASLRSKLPGQELIEQDLASRTAKGVSVLKETGDSPVDIAAGVTKLVGGEQRALTDLKVSAEDLRMRNEARLQSALGVEAGYELEGFKMNEFEPYLNAMKASSALGASGVQNIFGGLDSAGAGAIGAVGSSEMMDFYKNQQTPYNQYMMDYRNNKDGLSTIGSMKGGINTGSGLPSTGITQPWLATPSYGSPSRASYPLNTAFEMGTPNRTLAR